MRYFICALADRIDYFLESLYICNTFVHSGAMLGMTTQYLSGVSQCQHIATQDQNQKESIFDWFPDLSREFLVIPLLFFICSSLFFNIMNTTLFYFNILILTLLYLFIFAIISLLVYHSYMLGLVRLELYTCLGSYSIYPSVPWVNDRYCVGMVPIAVFIYDCTLYAGSRGSSWW